MNVQVIIWMEDREREGEREGERGGEREGEREREREKERREEERERRRGGERGGRVREGEGRRGLMGHVHVDDDMMDKLQYFIIA
mgnify:CR=1 FL=1